MKRNELPEDIEEELNKAADADVGDVGLKSLNNLRINSLLCILSKASVMGDDELRFNILNELMTEHIRSLIDKKDVEKIDEKIKLIIQFFKAQEKDKASVVVKIDNEDKIYSRKDVMFKIWNLLNESVTILKQSLYNARIT